jgi:hypothetical protein
MNHPIFHPGETCYALIPTSTGLQRMECEIMGGRKRRTIRDLNGNPMGEAECYLVLMEDATLETPWAERDLRKKWQRSDWGAMKTIWQPKREAR